MGSRGLRSITARETKAAAVSPRMTTSSSSVAELSLAVLEGAAGGSAAARFDAIKHATTLNAIVRCTCLCNCEVRIEV